MIDTKELRRLAQAATPGPWKTGQYLGSLRQFVIHTDVGDKGRGSDVAFTSSAFGSDETVANARLIAAANPATISELLDRLEAAEKERESWKGLAQQFGNEADALRTELTDLRNSMTFRTSLIGRIEAERDALQAKVEAMEKQEPVWFIDERGEPKRYHKSKADYCKYGGLDLLYALPGAQGEEK